MDRNIIDENISYQNISWKDVPGNPFGNAGAFNAIIFGDANNIVDTKGAMAIGGSFYSPRGLSLNFGENVDAPEYTPDNIAFLVGGNVAMNGSLVVVGHVVVNGGFRAARGSTFLIGKDGSSEQIEDLSYLYEANGQSQYWSPSDRGNHYIISSYDVPHYLPARKIDANVSKFFSDARESVDNYKDCIENLAVNGNVEEDPHEWVLMGNDPNLNVFVLDRRPNGLINKGIRFDVPEESTIVVRLLTGNNAHIQYGLFGDESQASRTLYLFENATNIYMEVPAAIWGSFLAPQAMLHGHQTGGHITGNVALNSFAVSAGSGFEFHLPAFEGQIFCDDISDIIIERPEPEPEPIQTEPIEPSQPTPEPIPMPMPPTPTPQRPMPEAPAPQIPARPEPTPSIPSPMPARPPREERPIPTPPIQPIRPAIPMERPCVEPITCPECLIEEGLISGCIWGCECCKSHMWKVKLYEICNNEKVLVACLEIDNYGCFEFCVPYEGCYNLCVSPVIYHKNQYCFNQNKYPCKAILSLNNIGVSNFYI